MQTNKNKRWDIVNYIVILLMLVCVWVGCSVVIRQHPGYQIPNYAENYVAIQSCTLLNGEQEKESKLPVSILRYKDGEEILLSVRLPKVLYEVEAPVLLLAADHCNVEVSLDGKVIYERKVGENGIARTEGSVLLFVDLPKEWQGKELTVRYTTLLNRIAFYDTKEMLIGRKSDIILHKIKSDLPVILSDFLVYFAGILLIVIHFVGKLWKRYNSNFLMVGAFAVLSASYLLTGEDWLRLIIRYQYLLYVLQNTFMMLLTIPLMLLIKHNVANMRLKRMLSIVVSVMGSNFLFMYALNFLFGIDFKLVSILTHSMLFSCGVMVLMVLLKAHRQKLLMEEKELFSLTAPAVACIIGLCLYYTGHRAQCTTVLRIGVVLYIMLQFYYNCKRIMNVIYQRYKLQMYRNMAYHDSMTGLRNRAAFEYDMRKYTDECEKGNHSFCVFSADVNNLKEVNDEQGHMAGDALIIHVANVLRDGVMELGDVYRTGGDEFVIFVKNHTQEEAEQIEKNIRHACIRFNTEKKMQISFSLGMAYFDKEKDKNLEATLARADGAMYEDKQRGKNMKKNQ